jgi:hypothetical protein
VAERPIPEGGSGYAQTVVAVFQDRSSADRAVREAIGFGIAAGDVTIDRVQDEVAALRSEMRQEIEDTVAGPGVGSVTREMRKGFVLTVPVGAVAGAAVGVLLGLLPFGGSLGLRVAIGAIVGAVAGGVAAFVMGGGLGAKSPAAPMAADRGVTVRVACRNADQAQRVAGRLSAFDPVRVDLLTAFGQPSGTVSTEEQERQ